MKSAFDALKYMMNGAHLPNWQKLLALLFFVLLVYIGQFLTVGSLANVATRQTRNQTAYLAAIRNDIAELNDNLAYQAERDSIRAKRLEKKIDRTNERIDNLNENGTDAGNERIDELIRTLRGRKRG